MSTPALNPLVGKIRTMHPGAYDDMDDAALTKAVLRKYPQYSDLAAPKIQKPTINMQSSNLATALGSDNTERSAIANPQQPAEQFALENPEQQGKLATAAAVGAGGTLAGSSTATLPFLARAGKAAAPYLKQAGIGAGVYGGTQALLEGAKKLLPEVGKIPGIDSLPFIVSMVAGQHKPEEPAPGKNPVPPVRWGEAPEPAPAPEGGKLPVRWNPTPEPEPSAPVPPTRWNPKPKANPKSPMVWPSEPTPEPAPQGGKLPIKWNPTPEPTGVDLPPQLRGKLGGRYVLTPAEEQQDEQIQRIAKQRAHNRGMQYAAGMKPSGGKVSTP